MKEATFTIRHKVSGKIREVTQVEFSKLRATSKSWERSSPTKAKAKAVFTAKAETPKIKPIEEKPDPKLEIE